LRRLRLKVSLKVSRTTNSITSNKGFEHHHLASPPTGRLS